MPHELEGIVHWHEPSGEQPVALAFSWIGTASFQRLHALCGGIIAGLNEILKNGHPLLLVIHGDVGGLLGIHCRQEQRLQNPIVSIDGVELKEFDYIDIGEVLKTTRAVSVVLKSLLFPAENRLVA